MEGTDNAPPPPPPPPAAAAAAAGDVSPDSHVMITTQPPSPAKVERPGVEPEEDLRKVVVSLQQALDQSEQQVQLINSEYRKLLADKEV